MPNPTKNSNRDYDVDLDGTPKEAELEVSYKTSSVSSAPQAGSSGSSTQKVDDVKESEVSGPEEADSLVNAEAERPSTGPVQSEAPASASTIQGSIKPVDEKTASGSEDTKAGTIAPSTAPSTAPDASAGVPSHSSDSPTTEKPNDSGSAVEAEPGETVPEKPGVAPESASQSGAGSATPSPASPRSDGMGRTASTGQTESPQTKVSGKDTASPDGTPSDQNKPGTGPEAPAPGPAPKSPDAAGQGAVRPPAGNPRLNPYQASDALRQGRKSAADAAGKNPTLNLPSQAANKSQSANGKTGSSNDSSPSSRLRQARQMAKGIRKDAGKGQLDSAAASMASAEVQSLTNELLRESWYNLIDSFGATLLWINAHVLLRMIYGEEFFCKLGHEWKQKIPAGSAGQKAGAGGDGSFMNLGNDGIGLLEVAVLLILDLIVLTIIAIDLIFFFITAMVIIEPFRALISGDLGDIFTTLKTLLGLIF